MYLEKRRSGSIQVDNIQLIWDNAVEAYQTASVNTCSNWHFVVLHLHITSLLCISTSWNNNHSLRSLCWPPSPELDAQGAIPVSCVYFYGVLSTLLCNWHLQARTESKASLANRWPIPRVPSVRTHFKGCVVASWQQRLHPSLCGPWLVHSTLGTEITLDVWANFEIILATETDYKYMMPYLLTHFTH